MSAISSALDFGSYSTAEMQALLTACKAEQLRRLGIGAVVSGGGTGQSFTMMKMSEDGLIRMINGLTAALGYEEPIVQVRPNFAGTAFTP